MKFSLFCILLLSLSCGTKNQGLLWLDNPSDSRSLHRFYDVAIDRSDYETELATFGLKIRDTEYNGKQVVYRGKTIFNSENYADGNNVLMEVFDSEYLLVSVLSDGSKSRYPMYVARNKIFVIELADPTQIASIHLEGKYLLPSERYVRRKLELGSMNKEAYEQCNQIARFIVQIDMHHEQLILSGVEGELFSYDMEITPNISYRD